MKWKTRTRSYNQSCLGSALWWSLWPHSNMSTIAAYRLHDGVVCIGSVKSRGGNAIRPALHDVCALCLGASWGYKSSGDTGDMALRRFRNK